MVHSRSFLNWLGGVEKDQNGAVIKRQRLAPGATLEVLWLENCHDLLSPPIDEQKVKQLPARPSDEGFEWVRNLSNLQVSFLSRGYTLSRSWPFFSKL